MRFRFLDLLLPREIKFYDYFIQHSRNFYDACQQFHEVILKIESYQGDDLRKALGTIKDYEKKGDAIEREVMEELNNTFITPLDREDIHLIVMNADRAMDLLNNLSSKLNIYSIRNVPANMTKFTAIVMDIAHEYVNLMEALPKREGVAEIIRIMHSHEKRGDEAFHHSMAELFSENNPPVYIIKFKEIYELLEEIIDTVDYIGKLIRGILVKLG